MTRLVISSEASRDPSETSDYFLDKSVDAGDRFVTIFEKKCQHLATYPYLERPYQKIMPGLRGLPLLNYIIFYIVSEEAIEILRVISGYRNLPEIFPR